MPDATGNLKDSRGKALIDRADEKEPAIWILKCWPSCWRLYFYVYVARDDQDDRRIIYLYAKCKKKQRRDKSDSVYARRLYNGIGGPGGSGHAPLTLQGGSPLSIRGVQPRLGQ
jgi:hypothetical protein